MRGRDGDASRSVTFDEFAKTYIDSLPAHAVPAYVQERVRASNDAAVSRRGGFVPERVAAVAEATRATSRSSRYDRAK